MAHGGKYCLHQVVEQFATCQGERAAVICENSRISYAELNSRANAVAHLLIERGVLPGDRVAVCVEPGIDQIVAIVGILKTGAAYVPINPSQPEVRISYFLLDSFCKAVVTSTELAGKMEEGNVVLLCIDRLNEYPAAASNPGLESDPESLLYVIYTSGTTGEPKGVMVSHKNVYALFQSVKKIVTFDHQDVWSMFHSCSFGFSVWEIWGALLHAGALLIIPTKMRTDPGALLKKLDDEGVTVFSQTPSAFRIILESRGILKDVNLDRLRYVIFSGEPLDNRILVPWFDRFGEGTAQLINMYAVTETGGELTYRRIRQQDCSNESMSNIGLPLPGVELILLDDQFKPAPDGKTGEMYVLGPTVAKGYFNRPSLTRNFFVPHPVDNDATRICYRTGDLVRRMEDGSYEFVGRADDQVKIGGYRIELYEIEKVLRNFSVIQDAVVVLQSREGAEARIIAYYVIRDKEVQHSFHEEPVKADTIDKIELWPSVGQYHLYDPLLYRFMAEEAESHSAYKNTIEQIVPGKVVVDLGTGAEALFARYCAAAGAKKVYAIELLKEAAEKAQKIIAKEGYASIVNVIHGDSMRADLPEKAEVVINRIYGNIGSADGVAPVLNDARRFLGKQAISIPNRCQTYCAALSLPDSVRQNPGFSRIAARYVADVFRHVGHRFDLRLCLRNVENKHLISSAVLVEDLDFNSWLEPGYKRAASLEITNDAPLDGFLLWLHIEIRKDCEINYFEHQRAWLPVFFPVFSPPLIVSRGDYIQLEWECVEASSGNSPDYRLGGVVVRRYRADRGFSFTSPQNGTEYGQNEFYRKLLYESEPQELEDRPACIRRYLEEHLPNYMIPSGFIELDKMPLNSSGKLDRKTLAEFAGEQAREHAESISPVEAIDFGLSKIWGRYLGVETIGADENFFDLGGTSITAIQISNSIQEVIDEPFSLTAIFDTPTITQLSAYLEQNHPGSTGKFSSFVSTG